MWLKKAERERDKVRGQLDGWDRDHSWHPFTQMKEYLSHEPLHVEKAKGCWLFDGEGRHYLDTNASVWTNVHGHNDPELNEALTAQLGRVAHSTYLGLSHPVGAELGRRLCEAAPRGLARVTYSDNGSNAIEIALKQSFQHWQQVGRPEKRLVVGLEGGYHGDTFGAMSVGGSDGFHGRFGAWKFASRRVPAPICQEVNGVVTREESRRSLECLEQVLESEGGKIAAVILEPWVQGPAGMRMQPKGFLKMVEALCRSFGAHLILDEVFVGFGRMGGLFVCEAEGVRPDFLCLAKGLAAGYLPLAATLTTTEIFESFWGDFESGRGFYHGHTFTGNPLAAAVALKSLEKLERLIGSGRLDRAIAGFGERVSKLERHPKVRSARQRGMAAAIDLYPGGDDANAWQLNDRMGMKVCLTGRKHGLLLRPLMDSILLVPPLVISEREQDFLFENLEISINETLGN